MPEIISLRLKGTNLHLESSPGITRDEFVKELQSWSQIDANAYLFQSSSDSNKKLMLKIPPGTNLDVSVTEGILSVGNLQGSHQMQVIAGEFLLFGFKGALELELRISRASLLGAQGVLRARLKKSSLENRASFEETWIHSMDSDLSFFPPKTLEGKLEIQGKGSEIQVIPEDKESIMIQAQGNDFHHFGSRGNYFITSLGKQKFFGFQKPEKKKISRAEEENNRLEAEAILQESQDLMNLFDKYEVQIDALYESAQNEEEESHESSPQPQSNRERYLLGLARDGKISLEELEKLLNDELC